MKKIFKLFITLFLLVGICGCAKPSTDIDSNLGGWHDSTGNQNKPDDSSQSNQNSAINVDTINFNTDPYLSGVSVEIDKFLGKHIIFKVTNNSDNCYRFLSITVYFKCMPLPNRKPLEDGEEYDNGYIFSNIPAHSTTYFIDNAFHEMMSTDKGGNVDGMVYYPFDKNYDSYRIELRGQDDPWSPSVLSKKLIQNARDYIVFNRDTFDATVSKLGDLTNKTNRPIMIEGFVVFFDGSVYEITNGSEIIDSLYEDIIPPFNEVYKTPDNRVYDCNSIYTFPMDSTISNQTFDLYINAWFIE